MFYLASASPRRHELLLQAGITHTVLSVPSPPGEDEPQLPGESPDAYVLRTAREKALRALHWLGVTLNNSDPNWPRSGNSPALLPILAADTTVILGNEILGKPRDAADAARILHRLSGTLHEVHTAVVLADARTTEPVASLRWKVSRTQVRFKTLSDQEISDYCACGEPTGKAGAYAIQGRAAIFIEHIHGSYSGVVGLPLYETAELLKQSGIEI